MRNPVEFIQDNILRDKSRILTPILTSLLEGALQELFDFHDWRFAVRRHTQVLSVNVNEYDLSGDSQNLQKLLTMFYPVGSGVNEVKPCATMARLYSEFYNRLSSTTPKVFVPLWKVNDFTWRFYIYPCSDSGIGTLTYYFKRTLKPSDHGLFSNPMVLIDGTLWRFFTGEKEYKKAHDFREAYFLGRELMRSNDEPLIYPERRIVSSEETKAIRGVFRGYQKQRSR